jgi:pimeloyl-ACP methyl ester carboxylesterase
VPEAARGVPGPRPGKADGMDAATLPHVDGVTHREVRAGGLTWHVAEAGAGPPLVLLHGWPQHWWMWRKLLPALAADHQVIAPDLPGLGWTDAPPGSYAKEELAAGVVALLEALGHDRVRLVGHDWGGYVALLTALRAPERVERLATLDIVHPWTRLPLPTPMLLARGSYQGVLATPVLGERLLRHAPGLVGAMLDAATRPGFSFSAEERAVYADRLREPARARASSAYYRSFLTRELPGLVRGPRDARRLAMPVLMMTGALDPVVRPQLLDGVQEHPDAGARIEVLPDCGHFSPEECPDAVLAVLQPFLRGEGG